MSSLKSTPFIRFSHVCQIVLVQACQHLETANTALQAEHQDMAMRSSSAEESRITLERPHTVLLLASLRGGYATRDAYTNAMADEFRKADGRSDIYEMHSRAVACKENLQ